MSIQPVDVPEGVLDSWRVERFTVGEVDAKMEKIRALVSSSRGRGVPEGTYTRLMHGSQVIMSDTPDERRDHYEPVRYAHGDILIMGLGLGMVLQACMDKKEDVTFDAVKHATVIEISPEVIALVGSHYYERYGERLTIIEADALEWQPPKGTHYNMVWFDIWPDLCTDNLAQMTQLKRRFARKCDWQGCWSEDLTRYHARQEKRQRW